jgi:hypothetical protein
MMHYAALIKGTGRRAAMADDPRTEDPETAAEPVPAADINPREDARDQSTEDVPAEVIDDDRFQATDN